MRGEDEIMQRLEADDRKRQAAVRNELLKQGRPDLVEDLDRRLKDVRSGVDGARSAWHSISERQRIVLTALGNGWKLVRRPNSRLYDATGVTGTIEKICDIRTARNLSLRELCHVAGGALDPEERFVVTERGLFILKHARQGQSG